jgi:hypothetical protein
MSSLFVALFALVASSFRTRALCKTAVFEEPVLNPLREPTQGNSLARMQIGPKLRIMRLRLNVARDIASLFVLVLRHRPEPTTPESGFTAYPNRSSSSAESWSPP